MGDEVGVGVGNSANDLFEEEASFFFWDIIILYIIIEFSSLSQFHNDEDIIGSVEHFV